MLLFRQFNKVNLISFWLFYLTIIAFTLNCNFVKASASINQQKEKQEVNQEQLKKPLKISIMDNNVPYSYQLADGLLIGYYVDFWELWSETNNIDIEFSVGNYDENIHSIINGSVDFHSGLFATENRNEWANYSIPFDRIDNNIFYLRNRKNAIKNILDMEGLRIAIQPYTSHSETLPLKYPEINFIRVNSFDNLINGLITGEFDAVIGEFFPLHKAFEKIDALEFVTHSKKALTSNHVYALVPKNNIFLVDIINQGIRQIPKDKLFKLAKIWTPGQLPYFSSHNIIQSIGLTVTEQLFLEKLGELKLGVGKYWKPIEFFGDDLILQGISSDYLTRLENDLDLTFKFDHRLSWSETTAKIKNKEIDILSAVGTTKKRENYLNFTDNYLQIPMVIVVKKNGVYVKKPEDLISFKVGASRSNPIKDIWKNHYPNIPLTITSSSNDGLQAVQDGQLDAFLSNLVTISPKIKNTFTELEVVAVIPHTIDVAFGVRKGLEDLVPILNKWLNHITAEEKLKISKVWLGSEVKQGTNFVGYALKWSPVVFLGLLLAFYIIGKNKRLSQNINERILVEKKLEYAKNQSLIANRNKEHFLANMSHEVRTPINALIGTAHLLEQSNLDHQQKGFIETLNYSANSLLLLVDDISDFSKIEAGDLALEEKEFDLTLLLKNIFAQTDINNPNEEILIRYEVESSLPNRFSGDQQRLGQIITNLLSNAIKFTKKGSIELYVHSDKTPFLNDNYIDSKTTLIFSVEDSGIGMTKSQQNRLFQAYSQTESSIAREYGGTGLGLTICKRLCSLMNGDIQLESEFNRGSKFTFSVQLVEVKGDISKKDDTVINPSVKTNQAKQDIKSILTEKEILIVDDNLVNLMITKKILLGYDVNVTTADNGKKAVELASEGIFDLILMDIQMPVMDGYEATKTIRETLQLNLPIIALSANVMDVDRTLSEQSGMNAHLGKPIKIDELLKTITSFL
ncbi:MAG: signal transduction histidine kinase [Polaribacter sp.]|jgi:signal transduction histidine kinase